MDAIAQSLADPTAWVLAGWGAVLCAVLLVLLRAVLPADKHPRLRLPMYLVVMHVGTVVANMPMGGWQSPNGVLNAAATLLLALALARLGVLFAVDVLYNARRQPMPAIFSDILQFVVYVAAVLVTLRSVGVDPASLFTTSALLTAVIGLSLQDTLGNLVAGLAIHAQKPFGEGDWIQFDNDPRHVGRVKEVNWRATRLLTEDQVELVVPNGPLAKNWIVNFSRPNNLLRRSMTLSVAHVHQPGAVRDVVLGALRDAPGVLETPAPSVGVQGFKDPAAEYLVTYHINEFPRRDELDAGARERVWYALQRGGMLGVSAGNLDPETSERLLRGVDVLKVLPEDDIKALALRLVRRAYMGGDSIIREGDKGNELFILEQGAVRIVAAGKEVASLGAGAFFGEMSLLTGEARKATVVASGTVSALVVGFSAVNALLNRNPKLAEELSRALAARQHALDQAREQGTKSAPPQALEAASRQLLQRIRSFFSL